MHVQRHDSLFSCSPLVTQLRLIPCDPMDCSPPGLSVHRIFQARILEWVAIFFSRGSSWPRDQTQVTYIAGRHFTIWAPREILSESVCVLVISKPTRLLCPWNSPGNNTGVGSYSLLQWIFLTQGLNPGLLHGRWVLYCLRHQGSPHIACLVTIWLLH